MSQISKASSGGGGGGTANALQPDEGAPVPAVAGNIPTLGQQASTVEVVRTYNDGAGNFRIADQTYETQYVVDASTTDGLKGTFTTINAAYTQAIADGNAAYPKIATILVRPGTYAENINFEALKTVIIKGVASSGENNQQNAVTIDGTITCANNCLFWMENILFLNSGGGDSLTLNGNPASNCQFTNCTFSSPISMLFGFQFLNCTMAATVTGANAGIFNGKNCTGTAQFNLSDSAQVVLIDCLTLGGGWSIDLSGGATFFLNNSGLINAITGTTGATDCQIYNCSLGAQLNYTGIVLYNNLSFRFAGPIFGTSITPYLIPSTMNNVYNRIVVTTSSTVLKGNQYIGSDSSGGPITLTFKDNSDPGTDRPIAGQFYVIKDESGTAAANPVTLTTSSGTTLIDGATTFVMNQNYESVQLMYDGSNYFTLR